MEKEIKFPMEFNKCPICGCPDTVCQIATEELKEKGKILRGAFVSLEKVIVPLEQPHLVATVSLLVCHYDVCAECGTRYCTRVDRTTGMAQPIMGPGKGPPPFPFSKG